MAYDLHSAYEAPSRAYMTQAQTPLYADDRDTISDQYGQYEQHSQRYGQRQDPRRLVSNNNAYDQRPPPIRQRDPPTGYDQDWGGEPNNRPRFPQAEERSYDPRYQQRAPRSASATQSHHHLPQPSQRAQPPRPNNLQLQTTRDTSQNFQEIGGSGPYSPRGQQKRDGPNARAHPTSMNEWKAREKARMQQAATSPTVVPFDNAFPVFGKQKQGQSERVDRSERINDRSAVSLRAHTDEPQVDATVPSHSSRSSADEQHSPYHALAHQPDLSSRRDYATHDSRPSQQRSHLPAEQIPVSPAEYFPDQWPMVEGPTTAPDSTRRPPNGQPIGRGLGKAPLNQRPPPSLNEVPYNRAYNQSSIPDSQALQRVDTREPKRWPAEMNSTTEQSFPISLPVRPSTSQGASSSSGARPYMQPQYAQSATLRDNHAILPNNGPQNQHTRHGSLNETYTDYAASSSAAKFATHEPPSREEEIEAEMPDFDSAAPGQTSSLQKRTEAVAVAKNHPSLLRTQTAPPAQMQPYWPRQTPNSSHSRPPNSFQPQEARNDTRDWPPLQQNGSRAANDVYTESSSHYGPPMSPLDQQYGTSRRDQSRPDPRYGAPRRDPNITSPTFRTQYGDDSGPPRSYTGGLPAPPHPDGPQPRRFYQDGPAVNGPPGFQPQPNLGPNSRGPRPDARDARYGHGPARQNAGEAPPIVANGVPPNNQQSVNGPSSNPDALPRHPTPVRPGHMQRPPPPPSQHDSNGRMESQNAPSHERQSSSSGDALAQPVTHEELARLRSVVDSTKSRKQELLLIKRLVEASYVLSNEGGRVDAKTAGRNRERFVDEAYKRLKHIVAAGYPDAQFYMADCYGQGAMGLEVDTKEAFKLYQAAAKAGHPQAAYRTAMCCEMGAEAGGGTSKDFPKAVQWYRRAASLGDPAGMYKLGAVLLKGLLGQPRNVVEAVNWLKRGAEKADAENPHALHELGLLYETTNLDPEVRNKVVPDDAYARELFQKAARLGHKFSQFRLGQAYEYGSLGLRIDNRSSIAWYSKAAAQGEHQAELALSGWYLTGAEGILEQSDMEAYLWARKSASSEPPLAKAMFAMGYFTENGIGCPASLDEARKWYGRAASYKFPKALERLEELKKSGTKQSTRGPAKPPHTTGKLTRKDK